MQLLRSTAIYLTIARIGLWNRIVICILLNLCGASPGYLLVFHQTFILGVPVLGVSGAKAQDVLDVS